MRWESVRVPLLLLAAITVMIAVQLIPLPPSIWRQLPGQAQFIPFSAVAGSEGVWRPLTMTPDMTLAALVGMSVPAAALVGFASLSEDQTYKVLPYLLVAAAVSALLGLAQILGGPHNGFYRYAVTNEGAAVGFFSNRNHQAVFLVSAWPMLALWVTGAARNPDRLRLRRWVAGAMAVFLVPMVVVTGSRAGLVLAILGLAFAWWTLRVGNIKPRGAVAPSKALLWKVVPLLGGLGALAATIMASRDEAVQRLSSTVLSEELRVANLPVLIRICRDFLPFGSGFGSFDPVFRHYEPDDLLRNTYLNHAHNDVLELVITGGIPAALIAIIFCLWAGRRFIVGSRRRWASTRSRFALLASAMITIYFLSSLVDYPLRTPVHAMLFVFACGWLASHYPAHEGKT